MFIDLKYDDFNAGGSAEMTTRPYPALPAL